MNRKYILVYEGKLKIVCFTEINSNNMYKYLFGVPLCNMEKTSFFKFGTLLY